MHGATIKMAAVCSPEMSATPSTSTQCQNASISSAYADVNYKPIRLRAGIPVLGLRLWIIDSR